MVKLYVLAGRYVALVEWRESVDDIAHHVQHVSGHAAKGDLDAEHVDVRLSLTVHALAETESHEVGWVPVARLESLDSSFELLDFRRKVFDDRVGLSHCLEVLT